MDKATFKQLTEAIEDNLISGYLREALTLSSTILASVKVPGLKRELTTIGADYERLLHYMAEGSDDPQRSALHQRFIQKTFRVLQNLRRHFRLENEQDLYALIARPQNDAWRPLLDKEMRNYTEGTENPFEAQDRLFEILWTSPQLNANEERQVRLLLLGADEGMQRYTLAALTLGLMHYFDAAKVRLLLEYCNDENAQISVRAVVGVVITCHLHSHLLSLYPKLRESILQQCESEAFIHEVTLIQHHLCLYQETERIHQRMEREIIPTLIKASQQREKMGFSADSEDDEEGEILSEQDGMSISANHKLHLNKEDRKKIIDSMKEMANMAMEGMDVNLHTFTALKGFPFFRRPCHWLAPYDERRAEAVPTPIIRQMHLCDADKYSLSGLATQIPERQRAEMEKMMNERIEGAKHEDMDPYQNYIQCLYRLFRRSPWAGQWPDIFSGVLLIQNPVLGDVLKQATPFLSHIGQTLLRHRHYEEAVLHLKLLSEVAGADGDLLAKMAYCKQQLGLYPQAIGLFRQALMLSPDNQQMRYHLQLCQARAGRYEEQLESLLSLEKENPDSPRILTETGLCLMQLERWEEAQRRFYKMELNGQRVVPSTRAIAWCALRMGEYDEAKRYYTRILEEHTQSVKWEDHLNLGHVLWLQGDIRTALSHYREYVRRYASANPEAKDLMVPFREDVPVLRELGKSASDITLIQELITL